MYFTFKHDQTALQQMIKYSKVLSDNSDNYSAIEDHIENQLKAVEHSEVCSTMYYNHLICTIITYM